MKRIYLLSLLLVFSVSSLRIAQASPASQAAKKEFTFHGKVEAVDAKAKTLKVNGEKVTGWMDAMEMTYSVDKEDVFKTIKVGDEITAKVYEGDFKVLHDIKVVPAKK